MQLNDRSGSTPIGDLSAAWSQVATLASAVDASLGKWLTDARGIGLTDYRALVYLSHASGKELRVADLAQRVGLNQSSATRLVSRLEARGLAYRDTCPDDGRGVYSVITEQGEILLREVAGAYEERVREVLGDIGTHCPQLDARQLARALRAVSSLVSP